MHPLGGTQLCEYRKTYKFEICYGLTKQKDKTLKVVLLLGKWILPIFDFTSCVRAHEVCQEADEKKVCFLITTVPYSLGFLNP